jgi:hypothetical protein
VEAEVPEGEVDDGLINLDGGSGVIEDSGDVFGGEGVVGVAAWGGAYVESRQVFPTTPSPTITNFKLIGSITLTFNYNYTMLQKDRQLCFFSAACSTIKKRSMQSLPSNLPS